MDQEDTEKKISYDCLRTIVDDAIKTKNICTIERIEVTENQLRYMQKYAELQISKDESRISFKSCLIGIYGVAFAFVAIGFSLYLVSIEGNQKQMIVNFNYVYLITAILLIFWIEFKPKKEFENKIKDIEFIHEIILKIEEKLPDRT